MIFTLKVYWKMFKRLINPPKDYDVDMTCPTGTYIKIPDFTNPEDCARYDADIHQLCDDTKKSLDEVIEGRRDYIFKRN